MRRLFALVMVLATALTDNTAPSVPEARGPPLTRETFPEDRL